MRPTSKYVINHTENAAQCEETRKNNEKVQVLMKHKHSCLSCSYFPTTTCHSDYQRCANPKQQPPKKQIRYYNICALHSEARALIASLKNS